MSLIVVCGFIQREAKVSELESALRISAADLFCLISVEKVLDIWVGGTAIMVRLEFIGA